MTDSSEGETLQIEWRGEPVGALRDIDFETVSHLFVKATGHWLPLANAHADRFHADLADLHTVARPGRLEVTVPDLGAKISTFLTSRSKVFFSLGSDEEAWLVVEDVVAPPVDPR